MTVPFKQSESAYTATAKAVQFAVNDRYDLTILDNPPRAKANAAVITANKVSYERMTAL